MLAIETHNLTHDFLTGFWRKRTVRALDGLSLSVASGEVFGLLGPNGAGKTTTVRMLTSILRPSAGWARVEIGRAHV